MCRKKKKRITRKLSEALKLSPYDAATMLRVTLRGCLQSDHALKSEGAARRGRGRGRAQLALSRRLTRMGGTAFLR